MAYEHGKYNTANELIGIIKNFLTKSSVGMVLENYSLDGSGYRLHLYDNYGLYNFRSAINEASVVDTQVGNLSGIAVNYARYYNNPTEWDKQTGYTKYSSVNSDSVACFISTTNGNYWLFSRLNEYALVVKSNTGIYQTLCFGYVTNSGTNEWIYMSSTVSGYLANYSTNNKYMLFSDKVADSGVDYGSLFVYNLTTNIQYSDYDPTNIIMPPIDDVTVATMDKFQSDLWEKSVNQGNRIPPLNKVYFFLIDGSDRKYIGYSNIIRLINIKYTEAEAEFVLGTDRFKAFPLNSMSDPYFYRGIAIRKYNNSNETAPLIYWRDETGAYVTDENGNRIPIN